MHTTSQPLESGTCKTILLYIHHTTVFFEIANTLAPGLRQAIIFSSPFACSSKTRWGICDAWFIESHCCISSVVMKCRMLTLTLQWKKHPSGQATKLTPVILGRCYRWFFDSRRANVSCYAPFPMFWLYDKRIPAAILWGRRPRPRKPTLFSKTADHFGRTQEKIK